jgi:hypothetical protein
MGQVILTLSVVHIFVSFGSNSEQEGEDEEQTSEQEELNPLKILESKLHCNKNPIYVFAEKILRGLSTNYRIHVSVSDLYIQRIGPHIFLQQNIGRATKNVETGLRSRNSFSGNICFEFLVFCLCSVQPLTAAIPYFKIAIFIVQDLRSYSSLYLLESKEMGYEMQKIF